MSEFAKILKVTGIIAGVVALGVGLGWLGTRGTLTDSRPPAPSPFSPGAEVIPTPITPPTHSNRLAHVATPHSAPPINSGGGSPQEISPTIVTANVLTNWEEKLDEILGPEGDEADKAKQLLEMFPRLPEDGQVEVAQHLSNLTADKDYAPLAAYLTNSATPEPVAEVLMSDLLNRPNSLKLPVLLDVARVSPNSNFAGEAKDLLELFLEEDYGTDWNTWQTKLQQWLADNPD